MKKLLILTGVFLSNIAMASENEFSLEPRHNEKLLSTDFGKVAYKHVLSELVAVYDSEKINDNETVVYFRLGSKSGKAYLYKNATGQWEVYRTTY